MLAAAAVTATLLYVTCRAQELISDGAALALPEQFQIIYIINRVPTAQGKLEKVWEFVVRERSGENIFFWKSQGK